MEALIKGLKWVAEWSL